MSEPSPLISVILPTYNSAQFLTDTLASLVRQDYKNWELIAVDDGSNDGSPEKLMAFMQSQKQPNQVRLLKVQHSGHPSILRNLAAREANGDFLAFLDSDDVWCAAKLSQQINLFKSRPELDIVTTQYRYFYSTTLKVKHGIFPPPVNLNNRDATLIVLSNSNIAQTSSIMVRRSAFFSVGGFDESSSQRISQDYEFNVRMAHGHKFGIVLTPLVFVRLRDDSLSRSELQTARGVALARLKALDKLCEHADYSLLKRDVTISNCRAMTIAGILDGKFAEARTHAISGFTTPPLHPLFLGLFFLTFFPHSLIKLIRQIARSCFSSNLKINEIADFCEKSDTLEKKVLSNTSSVL